MFLSLADKLSVCDAVEKQWIAIKYYKVHHKIVHNLGALTEHFIVESALNFEKFCSLNDGSSFSRSLYSKQKNDRELVLEMFIITNEK